jgi:hypothetical protein
MTSDTEVVCAVYMLISAMNRFRETDAIEEREDEETFTPSGLGRYDEPHYFLSWQDSSYLILPRASTVS